MDLTQEQYRYFLKDSVRLTIDFSLTAQARGLPLPPIEQPVPDNAVLIGLPRPGAWKGVGTVDLLTAIAGRRSRRRFLPDPLTLDELSFLLWATQGVRGPVGGGTAFRTVPSAGCRHSFETYLCAMNVAGLGQGIYRYLPLEHRLLEVSRPSDLAAQVGRAALGQVFAGRSAVTFVWTTVPYRMEWRYGLAAHKVIAIDAGHVCQNLYLACAAIGSGACAVAAYDQDALDRLLGVDGKEEFALYLAPVGKVEDLGEEEP